MKISYLFFLTLGFTGDLIAEDNYLDYQIPDTATKLKPVGSPFGVMVVDYMSSGDQFSRANMVAHEEYGGEKFKQLIKRELFKNGVKHGVQRTWHPNGQLSGEYPYKLGVMEGTFKEWDKDGRLVAKYEVHGGKGTKVVYDSKGRMIRYEEISDSRSTGRCMSMAGSLYILGWLDHGVPVKNEFHFYETGETKTVAFISSKTLDGHLTGPVVEFERDGSVKKCVWYLENQVVNERTYEKASAEDRSLPPYFSDTTKYKSFVTPEVKASLSTILRTRVKVPLEFDDSGKPISAE